MITESEKRVIVSKFKKNCHTEQIEECLASLIQYLYDEGMINEENLRRWVQETNAMYRAWDELLDMLKKQELENR